MDYSIYRTYPCSAFSMKRKYAQKGTTASDDL